jgi:hypothetical protein
LEAVRLSLPLSADRLVEADMSNGVFNYPAFDIRQIAETAFSKRAISN